MKRYSLKEIKNVWDCTVRSLIGMIDNRLSLEGMAKYSEEKRPEIISVEFENQKKEFHFCSDFIGEYKVRQDQDLDIKTILTREEEVENHNLLDSHDRFPASSSFLYRKGLLHRPVVNEYAESLKEQIKKVLPNFEFKERTYHGHKFAVALTRDIDSINRYTRIPLRRSARAFLSGKPLDSARMLGDYFAVRYLGRVDPHKNLREIIAWERNLGIRSSLYLMGSNGPMDSNYDISELAKDEFLRSIADEGWEIGFHPGYYTYNDEQEFLRQLERVREHFDVVGGRQHYLRFRVPDTWRLWEKAGMKYDATMGFADHEGFRCGTCTPFRPFDLTENRVMDIWEMPLTVMDCTLDRYRGMTPEEAEETLFELLMTVKKYRGVFVLLWHNTYFGRQNAGPWHDVFANFIVKALEEGAYVGTAREILEEYIRSGDCEPRNVT